MALKTLEETGLQGITPACQAGQAVVSGKEGQHLCFPNLSLNNKVFNCAPECCGCLAGGRSGGIGIFLTLCLFQLRPHALPVAGFAAILPTAPGYHTALAPALNSPQLSKTQGKSLKKINGTRQFPLGRARSVCCLPLAPGGALLSIPVLCQGLG